MLFYVPSTFLKIFFDLTSLPNHCCAVSVFALQQNFLNKRSSFTSLSPDVIPSGFQPQPHTPVKLLVKTATSTWPNPHDISLSSRVNFSAAFGRGASPFLERVTHSPTLMAGPSQSPLATEVFYSLILRPLWSQIISTSSMTSCTMCMLPSPKTYGNSSQLHLSMYCLLDFSLGCLTNI